MTYELNNVDLCLMVQHISKEKELSSYMLSILQRIMEEIWHKKTHIQSVPDGI